jgi:hypothetical protein
VADLSVQTAPTIQSISSCHIRNCACRWALTLLIMIAETSVRHRFLSSSRASRGLPVLCICGTDTKAQGHVEYLIRDRVGVRIRCRHALLRVICFYRVLGPLSAHPQDIAP